MRGPNELLDLVFSFIEHPNQRLSPKSSLINVALVCHAWRPVAQRRLFHSVAFVSSAPEASPGDSFRPSRAQRLKSILAGEPGLAAFVNEISVASEEYDTAETQCLTDIIRLCPNIRRVEIRGYNVEALPGLKEALLKKDIASLTVSSHGLSPREYMPFCTKTELYDMMARWSGLEKICCMRGSLKSSSEVVLAERSEQRQDRLRQLEMDRNMPLTAIDLRFLLSSTPNLTSFSAHIFLDIETHSALLTCLSKWSHHLEHLDLSTEYDIMGEALASITVHMPSLRYLRMSAETIPLTTILLYPALEELEYRLSGPDTVDALALALDVPTEPGRSALKAPSLRSLVLWPPAEVETRALLSLSTDWLLRLSGVCKARNVKLHSRLIRGYLKA